MGAGAGDGSTSILSLEPELVTASKAERATALDMLEREARHVQHGNNNYLYCAVLGERESLRIEPRP